MSTTEIQRYVMIARVSLKALGLLLLFSTWLLVVYVKAELTRDPGQG
jgi:hypothetical protein